jgi:glycosyltransferase involved in cell wall biosynthesis
MLSVVVPIGSSTKGNIRISEWKLGGLTTSIEIILVFDEIGAGSESRRPELNECLSLPFVKVVAGNFGAPGIARNAGMEMCVGDWIAFWDIDDIPNIDEIVHQIAQVEANEEVLVGQFKTTDANSGRSFVRSMAKNSKELAMDPGLWRIVFRRQSIHGIKFVSGRMGEDQDFLIQTKYWKRKVKYVENEFYNYFVNQSQQLTSNPSNISDLKAILLGTLNLLILDKKNRILEIFAARQLITIVSRGNPNLKYSLLHDCLLNFRSSLPVLSIRLIRGIVLVIISKVKA